MRVPVTYQTVVTVPVNRGSAVVVLENNLPGDLYDPSVVLFNTDETSLNVSLDYIVDFGVTENPEQTGTFVSTIEAAEWPNPNFTVAGNIVVVESEAAQPLPISRTPVLRAFDQASQPVRNQLSLSNSVDENVTRTVRLIVSGWIEASNASTGLNTFRTS